MVIGIKYCGGCNSTYDRSQALRKLMDALPQHTWVYASQGYTEADYWLSICGCHTACANTDNLKARRELITICNAADFAAVREKLSAH